MSDLTLFQTVATEFYKAFTQDNPRKVWCLADGSPDWMRDAVYAAHTTLDDRMPDDWIYESCRSIACALTEESDPDEDTTYEIADRQTDTATAALLSWLASHVGNADLVDQANDDYGTFGLMRESYTITKTRPDNPTLVHMVQIGQLLALRSICESLVTSLNEQVSARDYWPDGGEENAIPVPEDAS